VKEALEAQIAARQAAAAEIAAGELPMEDMSAVGAPPSAAATDNGPRTKDRPFQSSIGNRQSSIQLLAALGVYTCLGAVLEAGQEIRATYYRVLMALYGDLPNFDYFRPKKPTVEYHLNKAVDLVFELFANATPLTREVQKEIKWRGGSGRQPGGG